MSGLNRMARVKGNSLWSMCGDVSYIAAAEKAAEVAWKRAGCTIGIPRPQEHEIEIEVRCETDDPTREPYCFKMKRRVVWDCLNPRQGADDPKPKSDKHPCAVPQVTVTKSNDGEHAWPEMPDSIWPIVMRERGSCVPYAKFEPKQATSDPLGKSPVEPVKSDARKISFGFEKLHDMWLEKTKCQPERGCFQEFVSLLCILSDIEKEKDWIDVVIRVVGEYVRKLTESSIPHPSRSWSMLEWLKSQQEVTKRLKIKIDPYKPDAGWTSDSLDDFARKATQFAQFGQNGPGAAKVQVALPPKAPLRTKTDYSQELMFDIFVVGLNAEDWKAIQEIRSRRKTQVAG